MPKYNYRLKDNERDLIDEDTGEILATEPLAPTYGPGAAVVAKAMKAAMPLFKTPWNHDTNAASDAGATVCPEVSKAQQNQKEEADINYIVNRFLKTGELPTNMKLPQYADLAEIDFMDAMNQVNQAQRSFEALPANVRNAFQNDPARFLAYVDHCLETGDLKPLQELSLADLKVEEPAFEDRLAAAMAKHLKATEPAAPPGGTPAPGPANGAPSAP